jgi:hypothetical protein
MVGDFLLENLSMLIVTTSYKNSLKRLAQESAITYILEGPVAQSAKDHTL